MLGHISVGAVNLSDAFFLPSVNNGPLPAAAAIYPLDGKSELNDSTCNGNPAGRGVGVQLTTGPTGQDDGAYEFSSINYVNIPQRGPLNTLNSITILAWVKSMYRNGAIVTYHTNNHIVRLFMEDDKLHVKGMTRYGSDNLWKANQMPLKYDKEIQETSWYYVGATYDYATRNATLWVDGDKVTEGSIGSVELKTNAHIRIGGWNDVSYYYGRISCVQIYNKVLTKQEIRAVSHRCFKNGEKRFMHELYYMF